MLGEKGFEALDVPQTVLDTESNVLVGGLGLLALVTILVYKKNRPGKKAVNEPLLDEDYKSINIKNTEVADTQTKA